MKEPQIESLFREWWKQSFPHVPPGVHSVATHVAFGKYLFERLEEDQQQPED